MAATTAEVTELGQALVVADAEGDPRRVLDVAYRLLTVAGAEHARADQLAARLRAGGGH
jgi:hypothetical protein